MCVRCCLIYPSNPRPPRFLHPHALSPHFKIIAVAMQLHLRDAGTGSGADNSAVVSRSSSVRRARYAGLEKVNFAPIYERLMPVVTNLNDKTWNFPIPRKSDSPAVELVQFSVYNESHSGFYDWHLDVGLRAEPARRRLSVTVQLSNPSDYDGGNLEMLTGNPRSPTMMSREQGSVTVFPSYILHRVSPVTRGIRYSLVMWVEGI